MESSFLKDDVILLLKDITGLVNPLPTAEREKRIQGVEVPVYLLCQVLLGIFLADDKKSNPEG